MRPFANAPAEFLDETGSAQRRHEACVAPLRR